MSIGEGVGRVAFKLTLHFQLTFSPYLGPPLARLAVIGITIATVALKVSLGNHLILRHALNHCSFGAFSDVLSAIA